MTGVELQMLRQEMGWSQQFLAEKLGVTRSSLAHWEQGRAPVPHHISRSVRRASRLMGRVFDALESALYF